ncbi:MAG: glycosyltransferase [Solirubrobacterales bacterium]|nr:glycosyltransferase [Solirubrobacterales bacterium]
MRALIVTNMYPSRAHPARGSFVRDQVRALRQIEGLELELFTFEPGGARPYVNATANLRRRYRREGFDVVHSHFGLTAWPAFAVPAHSHAVTLHGNDLVHPRSRAITLAALRFVDLPAVVSTQFADRVPGWAVRRQPAVLPCGVDLERFRPLPRDESRRALGLDPHGRYLLFPHNPSRPVKRYDQARAIAGETPLLTLGQVAPEQVPLWVNAANAVLVPSEWESLGLAVLEALACNVPVLATPTGVAPEVLRDLPGALCSPFELSGWRAALAPHLEAEDPRIDGRDRAEPLSATRTAARVFDAWRALLAAKHS